MLILQKKGPRALLANKIEDGGGISPIDGATAIWRKKKYYPTFANTIKNSLLIFFFSKHILQGSVRNSLKPWNRLQYGLQTKPKCCRFAQFHEYGKTPLSRIQRFKVQKITLGFYLCAALLC